MWSEKEEMVFHEASQTDLPEISKALLKNAGDKRIWLFHGEMGSGKTTLIKALGQVLGVEDQMSSPTFSIINEYKTRNNGRIFHFDFYRIKNEAEAYDIGTEEYFYSGDYCFIEWPEKIPNLIPDQRAEVTITPENQTSRTLALSVHDGKEKNRI
jgi:tRNA threonylcarbamoyladenosine biosynthesis protein TsaE